MEAAYSNFDRTSDLYRVSLRSKGARKKLRLMYPKVRFALLMTCSMCLRHDKFDEIWTPKYLYDVTDSSGSLFSLYTGHEVFYGILLDVYI